MTTGTTMTALEMQLAGYRLTTAEILYRMPDHPELLQAFIWQDLDIAPRYPTLSRFLTFWETSLDGALHTVRVAQRPLLSGADLRLADAAYALH